MNDPQAVIPDNYRRIVDRAAEAAQQANRDPLEVRIVAITKYAPLEWIPPLIAAGCRDLGESRPQALWQRAPAIAADVSWHLVGHLQRNKIARTIPLVEYVHSVDSERLLKTLAAELSDDNVRRCKFLLEVNLSGETNKDGWTPEDVLRVAEWLLQRPRLQIIGLMGMSGLHSSQAQVRSQFAQLHELRDKLQQRHFARPEFKELSMGMSDDFEAAIAEGSTMIRIGSALFAGCKD